MDADRSGPGPGRRRTRGRVVGVIVGIAAAVAVLAAGVAVVPLALDQLACSTAERRVFAEVPHFGGARPRPTGNADAGSCMATYRAGASEALVLAHYRRELGTGGWAVRPPLATGGSDLEGRELGSGELGARRGEDTVTVLYESGAALIGGGTHVAVHVRRD